MTRKLLIDITPLAEDYLPVINNKEISNHYLASSKKEQQQQQQQHRNVIDIEKIVKTMIDSFSVSPTDTNNTGSKRKRLKPGPSFVMEFSHPRNKGKNCRCDLVSVDCLSTISCMRHHHDDGNDQERRQFEFANVYIGLQMRKLIKETSKFYGTEIGSDLYLPLGKQLQYHAMDAWRSWRFYNTLPNSYNRKTPSRFVNEKLYPDCMKNKPSRKKTLRGISCFHQSILDGEDSAGTILEHNAVKWFERNYYSNSTAISRSVAGTAGNKSMTEIRVREEIKNFLKDQKSKQKTNNDVEITETTLSTLGNIILFAHITRMLFNRRPFLDDIYQKHLTSIAGLPSLPLELTTVDTTTTTTTNATSNHDDSNSKVHHTKHNLVDDPFIVGLHIRRGDSCHEKRPKFYQHAASSLNSTAQIGTRRLCYQTHVYLDAVRRIRKLVPSGRPVHVYLATDDVGNILDEILHSNSISNDGVVDVVKVDRWIFLNYSRSHFRYDANSIEADENENQHILGETAVSDLWLLSHSHAFVGHLGSRFGKVAWLLSTSRHNSFIPFFSVDGHSFCCEIDENCAAAKPYITNMENCLTFGHEYMGLGHQNGEYWEFGSLARKTFFLEQQQKKTKKDKKKSKQKAIK